MSGLSDRTSQALANWLGGAVAFNALPAVFLALFTTAPTSDAGTGGTEVSGTGYARVQVSGTLTAGGSFTTASSTITLNATAPAWLLALGTNGSGVKVYDATNSNQLVGTVSSISGTTVTLTGTSAINSSGANDSLIFTAFSPATASSGNPEPNTLPGGIQNNAVINFPQATGTWGTVLAWGLYDAVSAGNLLAFDYLGNFAWKPFTCTSASPGVLTVPAHGYTNGDSVVVTQKYGGTLPTTAGSWAGALTVASAATDTFTAGVNTTGTGSGQVRKITQQSIPANVTASFGQNQLILTAA